MISEFGFMALLNSVTNLSNKFKIGIFDSLLIFKMG